METFPTTGIAGVLRLLGSVLGASIRPDRDRSQAIHDWMRRESAGSDAVIVNALVKKVMLVTGPDLSRHILDPPPTVDGYSAGNLKRQGMSFLAPRALTISDGADWSVRREFNERVLCTGRPHESREAFLEHVHSAFAEPVTSTADLRERMGAVMLGVVTGGAALEDLPHDVDKLIHVVQSPLQRKLFGRWHARRRRRLYDILNRQWAVAPEPSLIASARSLTGADDGTEQVPHWMFTFTGSGTDLLSRTLAMVGSRADVRDQLVDEVAAAGSLDDAESIDKLEHVESCLRETGRLFPPVTRTFHVAALGDTFEGKAIPAGMEIVHYFPLFTRDEARDPDAHRFRPERWLQHDAAHGTSSLFLSGARACPGEDLIMFICKAALAKMVTEHGLRADAPVLGSDPLPLAFSAKSVDFHA